MSYILLVHAEDSFTMELCREIKRRGAVMSWECEIRVDAVDEEMLRAMRDAGCYYGERGLWVSNMSRVGQAFEKLILND